MGRHWSGQEEQESDQAQGSANPQSRPGSGLSEAPCPRRARPAPPSYPPSGRDRAAVPVRHVQVLSAVGRVQIDPRYGRWTRSGIKGHLLSDPVRDSQRHQAEWTRSGASNLPSSPRWSVWPRTDPGWEVRWVGHYDNGPGLTVGSWPAATVLHGSPRTVRRPVLDRRCRHQRPPVMANSLRVREGPRTKGKRGPKNRPGPQGRAEGVGLSRWRTDPIGTRSGGDLGKGMVGT
jgi:hypothetical protein